MGNQLAKSRREVGSAGISHYFAEPVSQISEPEPSPIDGGEARVVIEPSPSQSSGVSHATVRGPGD